MVELARALPGFAESTSYGTPACKLDGVLLCRLKEDGETLVLRCSYETRRGPLAEAPEVFSFTEHYRFHPWILVALAKIKRPKMRALLAAGATQLEPKRKRR